MPLPLVWGLDNLCRRDQVASPLPPSDQLITIGAPVGQGPKAKNLDPDVRTIQASLNKIKPLFGGPTIPLVVDGIRGPKTEKAIVDFQLKQFGGKGADGVIEPGKQTITRINQILFSNLPVDPALNAQIRTKLVSHLDIVRRSIHAATTNLLIAGSPPGGLDLGRTAANTRLDHHFALDKLTGDRRDQAVRNILAVFNMYSNVLLMPGALGAGAFEADPTGDPRIAFTFSNGFFHKGEIEPTRNIPLDRIFLGRRAFFALTDGDFCAFIMLHEMAHFVGSPGGRFIGDNGRGWFTDDPIKNLSTDDRLHNADSYATFAVECRTGDSSKPAYVKASTTSR